MNYCLCIESEYNRAEFYELPANVYPSIGGIVLDSWRESPHRVVATYSNLSQADVESVLSMLGQVKPYRAIHCSGHSDLDYDAPAPVAPF